MAEAHIIINVGPIEVIHGNGLSGQHRVPPRDDQGNFGMLVVYPTPEIQDIGDQRRTVHWLKSLPLAKDICGERSEFSNYAKWGILRCSFEPEMPKELLAAIEEEMEFLNNNVPEVKYQKKDGVMVAINVEDADVKKEKVRLSKRVQTERAKFEKTCRDAVTKEEISRATTTMRNNWKRMVADGDTLWGGDPQAKRDISDLHKTACRELGIERQWCYVPTEAFACPGCGKGCPVGTITCGSCGAIFDREIKDYAKMTNQEKARALYPERYQHKESAQTPARA